VRGAASQARPGSRRPRLLLFGNILVAVGALLLLRLAAHVAVGVRGQSAAVPPVPAASPSRLEPPPRPAEGEALGRLELPRLGIDLVVFEGTSESTLRRGPGHLSGTAWPDAPDGTGNCVIAGHRDSFFRRLADARKGDLVRWRGPSGTSTYRLERRRIVLPEDRSVLAPTSDARLTLITCFPFRWTGSAPYRLAWTAVPVASASNAGNVRSSQRRSR